METCTPGSVNSLSIDLFRNLRFRILGMNRTTTISIQFPKKYRMQFSVGVDETIYYVYSVFTKSTIRFLGVDVTIGNLDK